MIIIICYITKFERTSMEPFDLSTRETLNGLGAIDADTMLATSGGRSPSGTFKSNCCNKLNGPFDRTGNIFKSSTEYIVHHLYQLHLQNHEYVPDPTFDGVLRQFHENSH
ncbi:hypothetical protein DERP_002307 [Dermatophagoides pteronyssinus]|uniref:Uncharacterized protein n=1 Tax=Dermatophagoides pteronyssinus TaxID=6956 RepID=A0ABQ8JHC2_DERPT|nr:hypothetical protein DERP_002307 [Dermatophagoides pteronyssinus]